MDLKVSGGPAYPTLSGAPVDEKTFRFEGMTLFDYYVGQFIKAGASPTLAIKNAKAVMQHRNDHLIEEPQNESK